jgi:hypothetical protein
MEKEKKRGDSMNHRKGNPYYGMGGGVGETNKEKEMNKKIK